MIVTSKKNFHRCISACGAVLRIFPMGEHRDSSVTLKEPA